MSAHHTTPAHVADHGHDDHVDHGSVKSYTIGFVLSVILTAIPFWLVMDNVFENSGTTALVILVFGGVQMVVHMIYFLHMNTKSEGGWTMLALIFTILIVGIALIGSIWVMYHLNKNMMPNMTHDAPHQMHQMQNMHEGP